jgi:CRP/FNR family transcriptional regulator
MMAENRAVLDISKTQLAALLGTIPETLSRGFNKLSKAGLMTAQGNVIHLRDRERLAQKAGELRDN